MNYRAGLSPDGSSWLVERSENGLHPEVIASRLPSAKSARAFIDAREGRLTPRSAADVAPPASAAVPGVGPDTSLGLADAPSGAASGDASVSARASARG